MRFNTRFQAEPGQIHHFDLENTEFARDVENGFASQLKRVPSRWLYDDHGSRLFTRISQIKDYYPTSREVEILSARGVQAAALCGPGPWRLIELGAGDGLKSEILLRAWREQDPDLCFQPLDVSATALSALTHKLSLCLPTLRCEPIIDENFRGLARVMESRRGERVCVLYLGSSIGNSEPDGVSEFLSRLRLFMQPGDVAIIGFDLVKDPSRLMRAYKDSEGVTREFNLNLLRRMNRELGAEFDVSLFAHEATWNPALPGMQSWLVSLQDQEVWIEVFGRSFEFRKWEPIHTETSLKFESRTLADLASAYGFTQLAKFEDRCGDFADVVWAMAPLDS